MTAVAEATQSDRFEFKRRKGETRFRTMLREAVAITRELETLGTRESLKLTPQRYLEKALDNCEKDRTAISGIAGELSARNLRFADAFVAKARQACRETCLEPPCDNLERQAPDRDLGMVISDCLQMPSKPSVVELVAVAVLDLVENEPGVFGTNETSVSEIEKRIAEHQNRLDELKGSLREQAVNDGEIKVNLLPRSPNDEGQGYKVTYTATGGQVDISEDTQALINSALKSGH